MAEKANLINLENILMLCVSFALILQVSFAQKVQGRSFTIDYDNNTFVKDGKPFRYISGSIHYSRIPYQYWDDRLQKMAAAGLNAIQTYVPWNIHETEQGQYDFSGQQDIVTFLKTAQKYHLVVILRPGPYICAEWEFGGLPAWLMNYPGIKVRTNDSDYTQAVDKWFSQLYSVIRPMLYENGGPIVSVQIENEYGSYYACDFDYLRFLAQKARTMLGPNIVLFTTDGDGDGYLKCGVIKEAYATVDFGITYNPAKNFAIQRHKEPNGPLVNSEFYTGWLDHWGEKHSVTPTAAVAKSLDLILAYGANVNLYMFEGGTNFGFWSGANYPYQPIPTSYDYDSPLSEAGDITDKYTHLRQVIIQYNPTSKPVPPSTPKIAYGKVNMMFVESMLSYVLEKPAYPAKYPVHMEAYKQYYGFMFYKHVLKSTVKDAVLNVTGIRDRGYVSIGKGQSQVPVGVVQRDHNVTLNITGSQGDTLNILVENQGRIGYGNQMDHNKKGIVANVTLDGKNLTDWIHVPVRLTPDLSLLRPWTQLPSGQLLDGPYELPALYQGNLKIEGAPEDTYLDMSLWTKGQVFINGENLGRYWPNKGPQVRLYVPKYMLQEGTNTINFIELEKSPCSDHSYCYIEFKDTPLINGSVTPYLGSKVNGNAIVYPKGDESLFDVNRMTERKPDNADNGHEGDHHHGVKESVISAVRWILSFVMSWGTSVFNILRF